VSWLFSTINEANREVLLQSPSFCGVADYDGELFVWSLPPSNKEKRKEDGVLYSIIFHLSFCRRAVLTV
jgi:hypothetical protein